MSNPWLTQSPTITAKPSSPWPTQSLTATLKPTATKFSTWARSCTGSGTGYPCKDKRKHEKRRNIKQVQ